MYKSKFISLSLSFLAFSFLLVFLPLFVFTSTITYAETNSSQLFTCNEINREINLGEMGSISLIDSYFITSNVANFKKITISLPQNAYQVSAHDPLTSLPVVLDDNNATITLRINLQEGESGRFTITYRLPWENYIDQYSWSNFNFTYTLFEDFNWTIKELTVSVVLPEGAEFISSSVTPDNVYKNTFQETISYSHYNFTRFDNQSFLITYNYIIFWASFRPILWMGVIIVIGYTIALLRRAPKPSLPFIPLSPDVIRRFVTTYEDKTKTLFELNSVEQRVRKGSIPRRRYRVRRKALEGRLSVITNDLNDLQNEIREAGSRYADVMGQIEVAEAELEGVEEDIRRVETRYRRRELSSEAYRKLLEEYRRRRERTETTLNGLLLRLQEEIR